MTADEPPQPFQIRDLRSAEWAMTKLVMAHRRLLEFERQAEEWKAKVDAWLVQVSAADVQSSEYFEGLLQRYVLALREANPDVKTLNLPNGTITTRSVKPQVVVTDADGLAKWLLDAGRYEALSVKPLVSKVREFAEVVPSPFGEGAMAITSDGEAIPGVDVEPGRVTATVKPNLPS